MKIIQRLLSTITCSAMLVLGLAGAQVSAAQDQAPAATAPQTSDQSSQPSDQSSGQDASASNAPAPATLTADQLDAMVAPIALYPDALVAQICGAATYPDQVAIADYWVGQNKNLVGTAFATAVDQQSWDPSVKALTAFPAVLDDLAKNLAWTSSLGQAFHDQQADVMTAVQVMRQKAQAAGTLKTTPQLTVTQPTPQTIVIQPADPQVVYVPQYNPTIVYGTPYVVPLYTPPVIVATPIVSFGMGIHIGAFFGGGVVVGGGFGWGWNAWHCNWGGGWGGGGGGTIIYNHNTYITNNTWHSGYYNNYHPWGGPGNNGYHPGQDTHYGPNGGYHPNGYYGPNGSFHHDVPGTGPAGQPNGGRNGNHGLIGGNGGVQHPATPTPNGGHNGNGGMIGGNGGVDHGPNGGRNGDGGKIGGNGSTERPADQRGDQGGVQRPDQRNNDNNSRSHMSGDRDSSRAASNRGRQSMQRPQRAPQQHRAPVQHRAPQRSGGGGGRRR